MNCRRETWGQEGAPEAADASHSLACPSLLGQQVTPGPESTKTETLGSHQLLLCTTFPSWPASPSFSGSALPVLLATVATKNLPLITAQ